MNKSVRYLFDVFHSTIQGWNKNVESTRAQLRIMQRDRTIEAGKFDFTTFERKKFCKRDKWEKIVGSRSSGKEQAKLPEKSKNFFLNWKLRTDNTLKKRQKLKGNLKCFGQKTTNNVVFKLKKNRSRQIWKLENEDWERGTFPGTFRVPVSVKPSAFLGL